MARIGYARVSTTDQNLDLQRNALQAAGCIRVFEDHGVSGAATRRCGLAAAQRCLKKGDVLVVWRLDRLGRSVRHLVELVARLQRRQVGFCSLTENIDTESAGGRMIFHVLAAMAEFERSIIRERTVADIAAARARGQSHGRRRSLTDEQCRAAYTALDGGEAWANVASRYQVHVRTLKRGLVKVCGRLPGDAACRDRRQPARSDFLQGSAIGHDLPSDRAAAQCSEKSGLQHIRLHDDRNQDDQEMNDKPDGRHPQQESKNSA